MSAGQVRVVWEKQFNAERVGVMCRIPRNADSFRADLHPDLKADFVPVRKDLANPPFNMSDWGGENLRQDVRWKFGMPPVNNANYAWIQHFIHHLSPVGVAGFVMANGSMSTQTSNEGEIRKALIEADLVDCMVALPGQLFFTTQIPVCLWFIARDKKNHKHRDRRGERRHCQRARQRHAVGRRQALDGLHEFGHVERLDRHGLVVIEDSCDALGARQWIEHAPQRDAGEHEREPVRAQRLLQRGAVDAGLDAVIDDGSELRADDHFRIG